MQVAGVTGKMQEGSGSTPGIVILFLLIMGKGEKDTDLEATEVPHPVHRKYVQAPTLPACNLNNKSHAFFC